MTKTTAVTENDIHAYVDGALDPKSRDKVEQWLDAHPSDRKRVQAYQQQTVLLHDLFDPVLEAPIPVRHLNEVRIAARSRTAGRWQEYAAGLLLFLAGGLSGWALGSSSPIGAPAQAPFAQTALGAHAVFVSEVRHPVEVGADQEKHLVGWLSKRLGKPVRAPALARSGYHLVGGRLLADNGRPAAQFMYENPSGNRLTIYVRRNTGGQQTAFKFASEKEASAFYWIDNDFAYALTGDLDRGKLLALAEIVYREMSPP